MKFLDIQCGQWQPHPLKAALFFFSLHLDEKEACHCMSVAAKDICIQSYFPLPCPIEIY